MADEQVAESTAESSLAGSDSAAPALSLQDAIKAMPSMEQAFGIGPASNDQTETDESDDQDPPGASAAPAALKPGESEPPKLSRRQQAEQSRQAELDEARTKWETEREQREQAQAELTRREEHDRELVREYVATVGDDREFERLNAKPLTDLSYEDQVKLDGWKRERRFRDLKERDAFTRITGALATRFQELSKLPGIDVEILKTNPDPAAVGTHLYEAGKAEATRALQEKVDKLEADNRALRAQRLGTARAPLAGGAAAPASNGSPIDWSKSASQMMAEAFGPASLAPTNGRS